MDFQTIDYELIDQVATITLNRPSAYNAMTETMNKEIIKALKVATKDDSVRCIVLTGSGKAFCSGQDLGDIEKDTNHAEFLRERYHPMVRAINQTPKPIVAAINGTAAGAGMSLALAADFRLMKKGAKLVSAFMNIGLVPDSGFLYILPRLVGYAKAMEISVLGKPVSAEVAKEIGLVTELIEEKEWQEGVNQFTRKLANMPTKAFALVKKNMMSGLNQDVDVFLEYEAQAQRIAGMSNDHLEGIQAFEEKRKPRFIGK
ncbi:enoyl-CoA hydratase-related protein [Ornithinibacillus halophilus]|uniref:2-(1,2-epoxy-1,2-dihydrophenyl)acetyl-CoA isomerase n=1 Tax=Ornithinibacillus halophilus TaxID=930117 RepID=A0A1M5GA88_9BACI|nr:enoyl-CoA hydratase-related protein [Ornithinibacillus halophilus]SHG00687.1 2-(1,2-epoxy-1,2-dihydrophenyl)acetyl-CoA isomerase [Ornithinibacillus halophilus]